MEQTQEHLVCMEVWGGNNPVDATVQLPGLDAWVFAQPHDRSDVGGDVYYLSSCATGRITRLLVADVAGHGPSVADLAGNLRSAMRRFVNHLDQRHFVRRMNEQFTQVSRDGIFATAVVSTFFAPTQTLSLCNAGHPAPLVYRAADKSWSVLEDGKVDTSDNVPLGIIDLVNYEQFETPLELGDMALVYTDSLVESRDRDGELLGIQGLLEMARSLDVSNPARLVPRLLGAIEARAGKPVWEDDVTILLIRANGQAQKVPFLRRACAPLLIAKSIAHRLRDKSSPIPWPDLNLRNLGGGVFDFMSRMRISRKR